MAVRLYPICSIETACTLVGVPVSTIEALKEHEDKRPQDPRDQEAGYEHWNSRTPEVETLDNFLTFGWGRMNSNAAIEAGLDPYAGETKDKDLMKTILMDQGEDIDILNRVDGLCWG